MVAKSGYNRCTAAIVLYAPYFLGGAAFFHLYDDQGYGQVRLFLKCWRSPDTVAGKLLRITIAWAQFCVGTSTPLLSETATALPHLEAEWLNSLRQYLCDVEGSIAVEQAYVVEPQRERDEFLMDLALSSGRFKPKQLCRVNYCRMYLNVLHVSDVTTANGKAILPGMYSGEAGRVQTTNKVNQAKPDAKAWRQWRKLLHMLVIRPNNLTLRKPLGNWLVPWDKMRKMPVFLYDSVSDQLFHRGPAGYTQHSRLYHDFDKDANQEVIDPAIPHTAIPVDVTDRPHTWTLIQDRATSVVMSIASEPLEFDSLWGLLEMAKWWEWKLLEEVDMLYPEAEIWRKLATQRCHIATDGSAPDGKGSFAWVISDPEGNRLVRCYGPVYGADITSYRAEGYGILSVLRYLVCMQKIHHKAGVLGPSIQQSEVLTTLEDRINQSREEAGDFGALPLKDHALWCDNQSMVETVNEICSYGYVYPNTTTTSEWDVLAEIKKSLSELQVQPSIGHIKSHQDKNKPYEQLSLPAQLNCDADELAGEYLQEHPDLDHTRVPILPTSGCQLHLAKGTTTHKIKLALKHARSVPPMRAKLCHKHAWDEETFDDIDWDSHGKALRRLQKHKKTLVQYLNDIHPVGKRVHMYDPKYPENCPSCPAPVEDREHLWRCPAQSRQKWRKECYGAMLKTLTEQDTALPVQELLVDALHRLLHGRSFDDMVVDPAVADIAAAQAKIGWHHILKGRFSTMWRAAQDKYIGRNTTKRRNGSLWMTKVIEMWLSEWLKMWRLRNEDRHGRDLATKLQTEERQAIRELIQFHEKHDGHVDQELQTWLFDIPLREKLGWRTGTIRTWLNTWQPAVDKGYTTALETA
jgi:hypothetical protein